MRHLAVILWVALLLPGWTLFAQNGPTPRFVNYSAADGLPSNTVYAVTQDAEGALWIGTRNGLARFDGVCFQNWKEYGRVNALTVDKAGRLWVGSTQGLRVQMPEQVGHDERTVRHVGAVIAGTDRQSPGASGKKPAAATTKGTTKGIILISRFLRRRTGASGWPAAWSTTSISQTKKTRTSPSPHGKACCASEATRKPAESSTPLKTIPPSCIPSRTVNRFLWAAFQ